MKVKELMQKLQEFDLEMGFDARRAEILINQNPPSSKMEFTLNKFQKKHC